MTVVPGEDWQSLWAEFHRIVPLSPDERKRALAGLPADRAAEIESLLAFNDEPSSLLDCPPTFINSPAPGHRVGAWVLLECIGEGGMGQVWRAERADGAFESEVAIKLLAVGLPSPGLIERFARERRILARLNHPDIARLLDGGTLDDGQPYLVMDYVRGQSLDRYCRERSLPLTRRLALIARICRAVDHAHRRLIIHRDLKPANILITEHGDPRLLDFGIAHLLDPDAAGPATRAIERRLTPDYASPEHLRGEPVDTRSDVYSLGVILHELLTGRRLWSTGSSSSTPGAEELARRVPGRPSQSVSSAAERRRLRGDLDRIVAHAVDPDPEQRYADARELGKDIERYLGGFPVLARPPSRRYRLKRFLGRHPLGAGTGLLAVVAIVVFGSVLWFQSVALRQALEGSREATARAEGLSDFLAELLVEADPQVHQGAPRSVDEVLADAARRLSADSADSPGSAALQTTLADIFFGRGDYARARQLAERALARDAQSADARLLKARLDLIDGRYSAVLDQTAALISGGPPETARAAQLLRAETYQTMDDLAEASRILDELVEDAGGNIEATVEALFRQGGLHWGRGDFAAAEASYRQAHELQTAGFGPGSIQATRGLKAIASARYRQGDLETAEALFRQAIERQEAILDPGHPQIAETRVRLGALLYDRQSFDAAVDELRRARIDQETAFGPSHPALANTLNNLALALAETGRFDDAEAAFADALAINRAVHGEQHSKTAGNLANLGWMKMEQDRAAEALPLLRQALAVQESVFDSDHPQLAYTLHHLGRAALLTGDTEAAERRLNGALAMRRSLYESDHPLLADTLLMLGRQRQAVGALDAARSAWREAREIRSRRFGENDSRTLEVDRWLGVDPLASAPGT